MAQPRTNLRQIVDLDKLSRKQLTQLQQNKEIQKLQEKLQKKLKAIPLPGDFFQLVINQLTELLNIDVRAILVSAWSQYGEFQQYLDRDTYPPGEAVLVPLVEHDVVSEHSPSLKPVINNVPLGKITFDIQLNLAMKGAVLKIQNGEIREFSVGSCTGSGSVKYKDTTIFEKKNLTFTLPGTVQLPRPVPIKAPPKELQAIMESLSNEQPKAN